MTQTGAAVKGQLSPYTAALEWRLAVWALCGKLRVIFAEQCPRAQRPVLSLASNRRRAAVTCTLDKRGQGAEIGQAGRQNLVTL